MSKSAIQLLILAVAASAMVAPATAEAAKKHRHIQRSLVLADPGQASLVTMPSGPNCPGLARSIDCKTWPPYGEDPDRKASGSDGGG
jgi:hypothetical protein